jgi:hypothetical protein
VVPQSTATATLSLSLRWAWFLAAHHWRRLCL